MTTKIVLAILLGVVSCSSIIKIQDRTSQWWNLEDQGVIYPLERLSVVKNKKFLVVQKVFATTKKEKVVESLKTLAVRGVLKKQRLSIIRPEYAYMELWVDKQRRVSRLTLDKKKRAFKVDIMNEQGIRSFYTPFPKSPRLFCFFSQLVDCLRVTGFFSKVQQLHSGSAKLYLIMEGAYLYQDIYAYYPHQLFVPAEFTFDGFKQEKMRFTLSLGQQNIFFTVDKKQKFRAMYWVAQQLNIVPLKKK